MLKFRSVKTKILALSISAVFFVALAMTVIIAVEKTSLKINIGKELDELARNETSKIAKDVYLMARATNETLQNQLANNLRVIDNELKRSGINFTDETASWNAINQENKNSMQLELPVMLIGGQKIAGTAADGTNASFVDRMQKMVGGTVTVFQRMNNSGDMLRVATTIADENGKRAVGTYIPATGENGKSNEIVQNVLAGRNFNGITHIMGEMYLTAYGPILDANGKVCGMTVAALKQAEFASLRKGIMDVIVGKTGYVFVLGGKGQQKGEYIISYQGKRDGENIYDATDADGKTFIRDLIEKGVSQKSGSVDFSRYAWKNQGEAEARMKIAAVTYFKPWDWVIGAGVYEDDFYAANERVESSLNGMIVKGGIGALLLLIIAAGLSLLVANRISKPLIKMVETANALAQGDTEQIIQVESEDEIGKLGQAFSQLIDADKRLAAVAEKVGNGELSIQLNPRSEHDTMSIALVKMIDGLRHADEIQKKQCQYQNVEVEKVIKNLECIQKGNFNINTDVALSDQDTLDIEQNYKLINESIRNTVAAIQSLTVDINMLAEAALDGRLSTRADAGKHHGDYAKIVHGVNRTLDAVLEPVNEATKALELLSQRDLTIRIKSEYKGDHAKIKNSLNATAEALTMAMNQVAEATNQVANASNEIASSSQAVASGASEQASSLEETSSSLEEMSSMTRQNADNAQEANSMVKQASIAANDGAKSMKSMNDAMSRIRDAAKGTAAIIKDINEIAFQTNLLALNAAVEAARAGEAGRGFAVVAEEVRALALRSKEAAKQTEELINQSVSLAGDGEGISRQVDEKLTQIVNYVEKVTAIVGEIAVASQEQARGIDQVNSAVAQMDKVTQQNAANAEESSSASQELSSQSQELLAMVASFKVDHQTMSYTAKMIQKKNSDKNRGARKAPRYMISEEPLNEVKMKDRNMLITPEDIIPLESDPDFAKF